MSTGSAGPDLQRTILVVLGGVVAGRVLIALVETLGLAVFPPYVPETKSFQEQIDAGVVVPAGAFLVAALGWALGAALGAWLAGRFAPRAPFEHALVTGGLLVLTALWDLLVGGGPWWFWLLGPLAMAGGGWAGARVAGGA